MNIYYLSVGCCKYLTCIINVFVNNTLLLLSKNTRSFSIILILHVRKLKYVKVDSSVRAEWWPRDLSQMVWFLQCGISESALWDSNCSNSDIVYQTCVYINCSLWKRFKLGGCVTFHKGNMWISPGNLVDKVSLLLPKVTKHYL